MKYLNLVLFEEENITSQAQLVSILWNCLDVCKKVIFSMLYTHTHTQLLPMADKILDFYAEQDPKQLTHLLLYSWLREYSTGIHITHTGATHTQGPHTHTDKP